MEHIRSVTGKVRDILKYFSVTRGHGHTESVVYGVKNTNGARIVTHTAQFGESLKRSYGGEVQWVTINGLAKLPGSHRFPIVFDNMVIVELLADVLKELEYMADKVVMAEASADRSNELATRVSEADWYSTPRTDGGEVLMSNQSSANLYKDILETIRMTLPEKYRPEAYIDISGAINLWMESKHKELEHARELCESSQAVTHKLQDEQEPPLDQDRMREYIRAEHRELMGDVFEMFMYFTKSKRIIIEDMET